MAEPSPFPSAPRDRTNKQALRRKHLTPRVQRAKPELQRLACGFRDQVLALPALVGATRVAAFMSKDGEPGTGPLLDALETAGIEVLIPLLRDNFDLDWGVYERGEQRPARFGLLEPTSAPLGPDAVTTAAVIICPGIAVDRSGNRLGRGGGSYDRALSRCGPGVLRVQLVYDDEIIDRVPTDDHDEPIHVIVTPTTTILVEPQPSA